MKEGWRGRRGEGLRAGPSEKGPDLLRLPLVTLAEPPSRQLAWIPFTVVEASVPA